MYSPKIREDLIPIIYRKAKVQGTSMVDIVDEVLRSALAEDASKEIVYLCRNCRTQIVVVGNGDTGYCDFCESPVFVEKALL